MATKKAKSDKAPRFPGIPVAISGSDAVVASETKASEAAGAYPITPSTDMGEGWAAAWGEGTPNVFGRPLIFFEPEGEHAAAAVTAGMSVTGLRAANFSASQGIAYMHESLYAAVGKRLTYVLNMACRAMTKQSLNIHCGHDDFHAVDDTGFFQIFGKNNQQAGDFNLIAHRIAELSLTPGINAMDGFLTSHVIETTRICEPDMIREFLGDPSDIIESPTPAQKLVFGATRRRIPELFNVEDPAMIGVVQNQESYAQGVAAQRPFYFEHIAALADQAFKEFADLTGRNYARAMGYRLEDAEYVLIGLGSVVWNAEAVADHLRERGIKVGVLNPVMFRPFPADLIARMLKGKKGVTVLERLDQPLAGDPPLMREIRGTMQKGLENHMQSGNKVPYPEVAALKPEEIPAFYSCNYGLGSRDVQPGDLIAAVENMLPKGEQRRRYYLGVEFVRQGDMPDHLAKRQQELVEAYPDIASQSLPAAENVNLLPEGSLALRMHSVGGWGMITTGKNLAMLLFDLLGLNVKANPKYGSEKKGQPTTFYTVFAREEIRLNGDLKFIDVCMSPDPNVFMHSNPLAGLKEGGAFIIQSDLTGEELWDAFPAWARKTIREKKLKVSYIDAFKIARDEASDANLQFRMQGAAFQGAFFARSPILEREKMDVDTLFAAIRAQLQKKFGHRGENVVEDNFRVIKRGFDETHNIDYSKLKDKEDKPQPKLADVLPEPASNDISSFDRFMEDTAVCYLEGGEIMADPFAAMSAIPAATGVIRDMTGIRYEVPGFVAENCTGCGNCWVQCPDSAIPGLVIEIEDLIRTGASRVFPDGTPEELSGLLPGLTQEIRKSLKEDDFNNFPQTAARAWSRFVPNADLDDNGRKAATEAFEKVLGELSIVPVARTNPFFAVPEFKEEGSGGLLAVTVNPMACKGCNLCVEVCPDGALISVRQDAQVIADLHHNWDLWQDLPDTPDRFVQVRDYDQGIGVLNTMLLKKHNYMSMVGGDGACMGCGEKTALHLVTSTIEANLQHHVTDFVQKIESMTHAFNQKIAEILALATDITDIPEEGDLEIKVPLSDETRARLERLKTLRSQLKDIHWRYTVGKTGHGMAALGMTNSTGCSSVFASTYPYNPYPYPWANHLFQDSPSLAIGIFEGHMRKMSDIFKSVRMAELELEDKWNEDIHPDYFQRFDWEKFTDEEMALCPPIVATGGDGAMLDIGFQNLSRLLASDKPIRVIVLDTQVYSNTGGQACTSGYTGQISDMATFGKARHGKQEVRKELGLIGLAHRGAYIYQGSQANASHLISGVLKGLTCRRPALFNIYTPCQTEHGVADDASYTASRMALECRAFPAFVYNPDASDSLSGRLSLDGNPSLDKTWPSYQIAYKEAGKDASIEIPLTVADWAASEKRFARHFRPIRDPKAENLVPFAEFLELSPEDQEGKTPFIYGVDNKQALIKLEVSDEMVFLSLERIDHWKTLLEMAGIQAPAAIENRIRAELEQEFESRFTDLKAEYEQKFADLDANYTQVVTERILQSILGEGAAVAGSLPAAAPATAPRQDTQESASPEADAEVQETAAEESDDADEAYIDTFLCTACNECTNRNGTIFKYNSNKQAEFDNIAGGPYRDIVLAAEACPVTIIHPGKPLNPNEPNIEEWLKRAEPFR